jgi:tetratricopeptide (TPR) repeat protein
MIWSFLKESKMLKDENSEDCSRLGEETEAENLQFHLHKAEFFLSYKEYLKAEDHIRKTLEISPRNADAWYKLGGLYLEYGDKARAENYFRNGAECGSEEAQFQLGTILFEQERFEEAGEIFHSLLDNPRFRCEALLNAGYIYLNRGDFAKSLEYFNSAAEAMNDKMKAHYSAGLAFFYHHDFKSAVSCFEKALALEPTYFPAKNALAACWSRIKILEKTVFTPTLDLSSSYPDSVEDTADGVPASLGEKNDMISIIISATTFDNKLHKCLKSCLELKYPKFEIILLPNRKLDLDLRNVRIIPTGAVSHMEKLVIGAKAANGKILAFIDSHAQDENDWITDSVKAMKEEDVVVISNLKSRKASGFRKLLSSLVKKDYFLSLGEYIFAQKKDAEEMVWWHILSQTGRRGIFSVK